MSQNAGLTPGVPAAAVAPVGLPLASSGCAVPPVSSGGQGALRKRRYLASV